MRNLLLASCLIMMIISCSAPTSTILTDVDPFIGTAAHGHVYPGATVPFGMVQLSPDNGTPGWDWCSGYNWDDSVIVGFSHTHLSGTGIGDLYDILLMPTTKEVDFSKEIKDRLDYDYHSSFSHEMEQASPGYYSVFLDDSNIQVELSAASRTGIHRYTFPESDNASIVLDLAWKLNWDQPVESRIQVENANTVSGYRFSKGWASDQRVYFAIQFSKKFDSFTGAVGNELKAETDTLLEGASGARAQFHFNTTEGEEIRVKVGLSSAGIGGAKAALKEIVGFDFEGARTNAEQTWMQNLSRIRVESDNDELRRTFYTALYHSHMAPVLFSDANGMYKGADGKNHQAAGYTKYGIFSLWDTFRAQNPLFTIIQTEKVNDHIRSMLSHYEEYGLLPVWELLGNETNTMTGYHAVPVIVDAYLKGFRDYDVNLAYEAVKKSAMQDIRATDHYRAYSYIPYDSAGQSVTRTLEYCYDDWCIAQMAKGLGQQEDYEYFMDRANWYKNVFDESTGFMRAKMADGSWKSPFDPKYSSHDFNVAEYTEGNAWQHSWFVPHDPRGLINLHGGNEPFIAKLDELFSESSEISGDFVSADISGLIGQYAHGNEPSHHIAYLYNYAGAPWKTQQIIRRITTEMYTTEPDGLCGNEDCGQMSAWYIFSTLGFYPVNPANGIYVLGSPHFPQTSIFVGKGRTFEILAPNASSENIYVQSVKLNGETLNRSWITHEEIMSGGKIEFDMGPQPNKEWGSSAEWYPPSMSD